MDNPPLVELRGVSVRRGAETLLDGIDWVIQPGSQWVVTGPNGSGKTLLMQVLLGKVPVARPGEVRFADVLLPAQMAQVSFEQAQRILAREQELDLARSFSGSEDEGTPVSQFLGIVDCDLPDRFGLQALLNSPLSALSNGEMRKVLLARALASQPRLLILDEPFDGLDSAARATLAELIRHAAEAGTQIILVTHHADEIAAPFTHLLRLEAGRVAFCGARSDDVMRPGDELTGGPLPTRTAPPGENAPPVIEMRGVRITYGEREIIAGLDWTVRRGEHWAIVGPNGAGKTTLLRLISADHLQAYANDITLFGRKRGSGESIWEIKRRMGVLSPELQFHYREGLSVGEVVLSGFFDSVGLYRRATPAQQDQAAVWLDLLALDGAADYGGLSYGQKRVVLLARALVKSPDLLLLDEPCQGLDPANSRRLIELVSRAAEERGTQILYVTHRREELPRCITHLLEFQRNESGYSVTQSALAG